MKLTYKLITIIVIPILIFAITYQLSVYFIIENQTKELTLSEASSLITLGSQEIRNPLYFFDVDATNEIINNIKLHPEVISIVVLFPDGRIFTDGSSDNPDFHQIPNDEFTKKSIESNEIIHEFHKDFITISTPIVITEKIGILQIDYTLYKLDSIVSESMSYLLVISFLASWTAGTIGYFFSRSISEPVKHLRKMADRISEGVFDVKLEKIDTEELQQLGKDLKKMAKKLEESREYLIKSERLSSIGETSSRISHDLRNPLHIMQNSLDLLEIKSKGKMDSESTRYISMMRDQIELMTHLVNEVLDFARVKPLKLETVGITKILNMVTSSMKIPENIKIKFPKNDVKLFCDIEQIKIVFINLFSNAIVSIGDKEGEILIKVNEDNEKNIIDFEDSGAGISSEDLDRVFEPLFSTKKEGIGLGLISCKTIIEHHGGNIKASNVPSGGALFTITLPKKPQFN
jgi:signal transduction histidine kinase